MATCVSAEYGRLHCLAYSKLSKLQSRRSAWKPVRGVGTREEVAGRTRLKYTKSVTLYLHNMYDIPKMRTVPSHIPLIMDGLKLSQAAFIVTTTLALIAVARFIYIYVRARLQFPGPPVKNFWTGNLDQTMADNVHEKVGQAPPTIRNNVTASSGCNGIANMVTFSRRSVCWFIVFITIV